MSTQELGSAGLRGASAALLAQFRHLYVGQIEYSDDSVIDIMRAMAAHRQSRGVRSMASTSTVTDSAPIDLTSEQADDDSVNSRGRQREGKQGDKGDGTEDEDEQKTGSPSMSSTVARDPRSSTRTSSLSSRRRVSSLTPGWEEEVADRAASLVLLKQDEAVRQEKAASMRLWRERGRSCRSLGRRLAMLLCWIFAALLLLVVLAVIGCWVAPWMMEMREQLVGHAEAGSLWDGASGAETADAQSEAKGMLEQAWVALSTVVEQAQAPLTSP